MSMTENEVNIYSIAYRDCKEVSDGIDVNEELGKESAILFYMDEILEALKIASELQAIGTIEEFKALKEKEERFDRNIKMFNEIGLEIRNKAIDGFAEKLKAELNKRLDEPAYQHSGEDYYVGICSAESVVDEIAEQMKGV